MQFIIGLIELTNPKLVEVIPDRLCEHCHDLKVLQFEEGSVLKNLKLQVLFKLFINQQSTAFNVYKRLHMKEKQLKMKLSLRLE